MDLKYAVDIGSLLAGRTLEIEAHSAQIAYNEASGQIDRNKFEKIIQIRSESGKVLYSCWDDQGFNIRVREE
jgi:hypothetical protein